MALSGTWSFTVVRDDIIREAMLNVGAIGEAEVPTAQEVTDCARKLNMMVKSWMGFQDFAPGLKMWERKRADMFLRSNQGVYVLGGNNSAQWAAGVALAQYPGQTSTQTTLTASANAGASVVTVASSAAISIGDIIGVQGTVDFWWTAVSNVVGNNITLAAPIVTNSSSGSLVYSYTTSGQRPLAIVTCVLRDSFNQDIPMNRMTLEDYEMLPTKAQPTYQSDPTAFYYESQFTNLADNSPQGGGRIYLDVGGAQDITKFLHIVYMRPIMDFNNPGDNPEYPQQWYRALCWGLSKEICGMFDATWTKDMEDNKNEAIAFAKEADSETTSLYFQPNAIDPYGV